MDTIDPVSDFLRECEAHCERTGMGRSVLSHVLFNRGSRLDELAGNSSLSIATSLRS